jgi:hypothetical protein
MLVRLSYLTPVVLVLACGGDVVVFGDAGPGGDGGNGAEGGFGAQGGSGAQGGVGNAGGSGAQGGTGAQGGVGNSGGMPECTTNEQCAIDDATCMEGVCDQGHCTTVTFPDGTACEDFDPCTFDGICIGGNCTPGPIQCGGDQCNDGVCTVNGCTTQPKANGTPCNDSNPCTSLDACNAGMCIGSGGPVVYFSDDFSTPNMGWTLGTEWQIGPATVSTGQSFGNPDPAQDHSASNDNMLAGVVIGGNTSTMTHQTYWLESPSFDATVDPGPVVLSFQRWLNSDWDPWMNNRIEVWNGAQWQPLWQSGANPVTDAAWTPVTHDLTAFKNAAMRIRFGVEVGNIQGVFVVSSWNIDDVVVATALCP